jgi:uncharacterized protein with PIN domain/sulfur carrier protein ThiS
VSVRIYGTLGDFLPRTRRQTTLVCSFEGSRSVKDLVEQLGIPHPEIDVLVVNGALVDFAYPLRDCDRVAVYPRFEAIDVGPALHLAPPAQAHPRFVADVHLGRLAAYLRLAGFDTTYRNDLSDHEIVAISAADDRTVLTRDVGLLKHRRIVRGCFLRNTEPARQLLEVMRRFALAKSAAPFTRCLRCNAVLIPVPKEVVDRELPPRTRDCQTEFARCPECRRVYWPGSHYSRMRLFIETALVAARGEDDRTAP